VALRDYYTSVRPFFAAEMALRSDVPEWVALARRLDARTVLDLGCGGGRIGAAIAADDPRRTVVGIDVLEVLIDTPPAIRFAKADMRDLPFDAAFDLVVAANDPFCHLVDDGDRTRALAEARRVLRPGGSVVIDGLYVPGAGGDLEKTRDLRDGTILRESWRAAGADVYATRFTYTRNGHLAGDAETRVRAWSADEPSLRACAARVAGGLDGRPFDSAQERFVIFMGRAS